jgi:iron(III) transport system substrate-binding protein
MSDEGGTRSFHPEVKLKDGRKALSEIKLMQPDVGAQEKALEEIRTRYAKYFGV